MHITESYLAPLLVAFVIVIGLPLGSLALALFSDEKSEEAPSPREPLMVDKAYPSTWLAPGWNRKYLKAPLSCTSLMELYTTSVRYVQERDYDNANAYCQRCLDECLIQGFGQSLLEANILNNFGVLAFERNVAKAEENFLAALAITEAQPDQITIASVARNLAAVFLFKNELAAAQSNLDTAEAAIVARYGPSARELVDIECLQKAIDRAAGKRIGRR